MSQALFLVSEQAGLSEKVSNLELVLFLWTFSKMERAERAQLLRAATFGPFSISNPTPGYIEWMKTIGYSKRYSTIVKIMIDDEGDVREQQYVLSGKTDKLYLISSITQSISTIVAASDLIDSLWLVVNRTPTERRHMLMASDGGPFTKVCSVILDKFSDIIPFAQVQITDITLD